MWLETTPGKNKNKNETSGEVLLQGIGMPSPEWQSFEKNNQGIIPSEGNPDHSFDGPDSAPG